jgi:hypothetical protein
MNRFYLLPALAAALAVGAVAQTVNINCGGGAMTTSDGTQWSADMDFSGGDLLYTGYAIANTNPQDLYLMRSGRAGLYGDFSYNIPVPNGSYTVTLHFAEIQYSGVGQRVFNVSLNGATVLSNFDILAHAPVLTPLTEQFPVTVTNGAVQLGFQGVSARALVNAIQVAPASGGSQPPPSNPALSVGSTALSFAATAGSANPSAQTVAITNSGTGTLNWTASTATSWLSVTPSSGTNAGAISIQPKVSGLAAGTYTGSVTVSASGAAGSPVTIAVTMVVAAASAPPPVTQAAISINCGGEAMTTSDGTQWSADNYFSGGQQLYTGYAIAGIQPQDYYLYRAARAGLYGDFSYSIPLANGSYTVTLTFAEIQYSGVGQRVFNVAINGLPVLNNFDILTHVPVLTPYKPQFTAVVTNGILRIDVTGVVQRGVLNAIQVASSSSQPLTPSSLVLSGTTANFSGTAGGSNPAAQTIGITNGGGSSMSWTASSSAAWLGVSPASGVAPGSLSLQANLAGLSAGTYTGTVTVSAPGATNGTQTIAASLTVTAPPPTLAVSMASLSFSGVAGGSNPNSQVSGVSNSGGGTLNWTASSNQSWLSVSPASGMNSGTLTVGTNLAGLAAGSYSGAITVSGGGSTKTIAVTLAVTAVPSPSLAVSTTALSFTGTAGSASPSAQTVGVSNTGGGTLSWTASSSAAWLTVSPGSGTGAGTLTIAANTGGMSAGSYSGTIAVNGGAAGSKSVTVSFTVAAASQGNPPVLPSGGNNWFVTVNGSPSGDGSAAHPWDIVTALNAATSKARPGDTIWLRAGRYGGGQASSVLNSTLVGTPSAPIVVRAYPGERATIDTWLQVGCCDQANNPANGSYIWFWGLEFASYNPNRVSGTSGPPEWAAQQNHNSADTWAAGTKFINCIVHDTGGGLSVWDADNSELNGNIVFNVGGYGTDRGHGHDFYVQNIAPSILKLTDNIGFNNFDMGIQSYGSGEGAWVQNIQLAGNIVFNSGILYGQLVDNVTIGGGQGGPSGIVLNNNFFYNNPVLDQGYNEIGYLWTPEAHDAIVTNNYFIGGKQAIDLERWDSLTFQNNTVYAASEDDAMLITNAGQNSAGYIATNNHYYGSGQFRIDAQCGNWPCPTTQVTNLAGWQSQTGMDSGSSFTGGQPTGVWTSVRPNQYETGRANVVIFNWDLKPAVAVDLSSSGIKVGDSYQIRDAENWYGGPVVSGVYNGSPVNIPMTGLTVVQPFGSVPYAPSHTAPQFGAFVLLSGTALANTY